MTEPEEPQIDPQAKPVDPPPDESSTEPETPGESSYWPPDLSNPPMPNAVPYRLTKSVNLAQLRQEITDASGADDVGASTFGPYPDGTVILWLVPPSLESETVEQVIEDHAPDSDWGTPQVQKDFQAVMTKLAEDPDADLTSDEVKAIAVSLALRSTIPTGAIPLSPLPSPSAFFRPS